MIATYEQLAVAAGVVAVIGWQGANLVDLVKRHLARRSAK